MPHRVVELSAEFSCANSYHIMALVYQHLWHHLHSYDSALRIVQAKWAIVGRATQHTTAHQSGG